MDIEWVRDASGGGRESGEGWLLATVGADGKVGSRWFLQRPPSMFISEIVQV